MISGAVAAGVGVVAREAMKKRDEEIKEERERVRAEEAIMNQNRPLKSEFKHFTHIHPLAELDSTSVPCEHCGVCRQPVVGGWAYHCSSCNYFLHQVCATNLVSLSSCSCSHAKEITSPVDQTIISTFAHKDHPVKGVYSTKDYKCSHCFTPGYGKRFQCVNCKVNLHPICATCPTKITSFMHPQHELELKTRRHFTHCAVCNKKTKSNCRMYKCKACRFFVHPACSQLPQHLMHELHPVHPLQLRPAQDSLKCEAKCGSKCKRGHWCYECEACKVSIHINCVLGRSIGDNCHKKKTIETIQTLAEIAEIAVNIGNM